MIDPAGRGEGLLRRGPIFKSVLDDPDEFNEAVEAAVASIVPRANLDGRTSRAHLGQAVLRSAVRYYGRRGGNSLRGLTELLAAIPDGVSELDNAAKIGGESSPTTWSRSPGWRPGQRELTVERPLRATSENSQPPRPNPSDTRHWFRTRFSRGSS